MSNTLPTALTRLSEHILTITFDPYDHYAACWVTLTSCTSPWLISRIQSAMASTRYLDGYCIIGHSDIFLETNHI